VYVEAFLLQIILSEFLQVPTSIETGAPGSGMNFYNPLRRYGTGTVYDVESLQYATWYDGDCLEAMRHNDGTSRPYDPTVLSAVDDYTTHYSYYGGGDDGEDGEDDDDGRTRTMYIPCAHIVPEIWDRYPAWEMERDQIIEAPQGLGVLGQEGWYVPRFTGRRDPSLLSYLGLEQYPNSTDHEVRRKLASMFLRPVTYQDYCTEVSTTNCTVPDGVASRPPNGTDGREMDSYFWQDDEGQVPIYTGYFRPTDENNCTAYPDTCTGHLADYPCGWTASALQQSYHLNIPLRSSGPEGTLARGYPYESLVEIWKAANYTQSDVVMYWWTPDALVDMFAGTDAEFTKITLPAPTQQCIGTSSLVSRTHKHTHTKSSFEILQSVLTDTCFFFSFSHRSLPPQNIE
jgi:hypothetical protein